MQFGAIVTERDLDPHGIIATKCGLFTEESGLKLIDQMSCEARTLTTGGKGGVPELSSRLQSRGSR